MARGGLSFWGKLKRDARFIRGLSRTNRRVRSVSPTSPNLVCDDLEAVVDRHPQRPALAFEGRTLTYAQMDALANRYAHWAKARNIKRGDVVALFTPNRLEYVPIWYGLSKVGVVAALIDDAAVGADLVHCLDACGAAHLICDAWTAPAFEAVRAALARSLTEWIVGGGVETGAVRGDRDLDRTLKGVSALRPDRETARAGLTAKDLALYVYTGGATGPPKAARVTHMRAQVQMRGFAAATEAGQNDRTYNPLPLHSFTGGLCGIGPALLNGGLLLIKRGFSADRFWEEAAADEATLFVYAGELCRRLLAQPERAGERDHKLKLAFGAGLSGEAWPTLVARFAVPRVLESYGATEGNVSLINFDGRVGAVGRTPRYLRRRSKVRLAAYDLETGELLRDGRGLVVPVRPGQVGEALGAVDPNDPRAACAGYGDRAASEARLVRDVAAKGDVWFRTGDLMREDEEGYIQFVDRTDDAFRCGGEDVFTREVAERLTAVPAVLEAAVYGVETPSAKSRAAMAALVVGPGFDLEGLAARIDADLPPHARPRLLRLTSRLPTTATLRIRKTDLLADGYDPERMDGPAYVRESGGPFRPLDAAERDRITSGQVPL